MRKSLATAIALTVAITLASPVAAAPRHKDRTEPPAFAMILKKLVKKVFGITSNAEPTVPVPTK